MKENEAELSLTDLLTTYIQQFKATMAVRLTLIEAICQGGDSLQNNPQFLLSKYSTKSFISQWPVDPHSIPLSLEHSIIINRFYLRLYEYLQFRLGNIMSLNEGAFAKETEHFQRQLQAIIKRVQSREEKGMNFGQFFLQLNRCQHEYSWQMLDRLQKGKVHLKRGIVDGEVLEEVKTFFRNKLNKEQNGGLASLSKKMQINANRPQRLSLPVKTEETSALPSWIVKRLQNRKPVQPVKIIPIGLERNSSQNESQEWLERQNSNISQDTMELSTYVKAAKKNCSVEIYGITDLDDAYPIKREKEELLSDLFQRNLKNKIHIDTFITRYERKLEKREQKQNKERSARSTVKTSKGIAPRTEKSEDFNLFQPKIDSMQSFTPLLKSTSSSVRRGPNIFELPPIVNRHGRKITLQK